MNGQTFSAPVAQVVSVDPPGPDGHGVNWLSGKRPKPGDLLYAAAQRQPTGAPTKEIEMSERLKQYIEKFGHIVGTEFTPEEIPAMERVAKAYLESFNRSFEADCQRNRDAH